MIYEDKLMKKCGEILGRLQTEGRTPMMRFIFSGWTRGDYEALDQHLAGAETPTSRCLLPGDEGILVGSEGWTPAPHLSIR
jgi:hypothetical protein